MSIIRKIVCARAARGSGSSAGGGDAHPLRCGHHHSRFSAADDARGHGRKDVRASRLHDRHCAGHLSGSFAHALAGSVVVLAQRRLGRRTPGWCAFFASPTTKSCTGRCTTERSTVLAVILVFFGSLALFPFLGTSFIPEMQEGTLSPNADRVPNISLDESLKMEREMQRLMLQVPGVDNVVSRVGRGESPADPAGPNEADVIASLTPFDKRPHGMTQEQDRRADPRTTGSTARHQPGDVAADQRPCG